MSDLWLWVERHQWLAAWVQGIGSLLAVAGAAMIALLEHFAHLRQLRRERALRATVLVITFWPALAEVEAAMRACLGNLEAAATGRAPPFQAGPDYYGRYRVALPPILREFMRDVYLLDERLAANILELIALVERHNRIVDTREAAEVPINAVLARDFLAGALAPAQRSIAMMKPIFDRVVDRGAGGGANRAVDPAGAA
ncbi:MAG: hypothetical protein JO209_03175 [Acidisphaera sp.]|nr:hypothetical protein [Acidisphaera sp.]